MTPRENGSEEEPVIRDKRKIDPETGTVRHNAGEPADGTAPGGQGAPQAPSDGAAAGLLAERTADLQRLQAEYSNYRKRVDRDRIAVKEHAVASVLSEFLPVLDDIGRARDHGELTGGFAKVSESLEAAVGKLGLTTYGTKGDPFDPTVHEALLHSYSADVTEPTCIEILQPGYRIGERVLRPARVAVAEPSGDEERVVVVDADDSETEDAGEAGENGQN
ncbi:nucleotide exchange factor GrpE [Planotetraspora kaengkrachanensis]|uniref:Protein GrpE n=1 Tax=Planotetraspora kaengkrachanensis TaxID=575193 RepID=A0A8J3LU52_9ACTN|nr:nucleotide exchange factor GrpE [Planotetraspora kaengkrachanensis]GIG78292.1 protein GrpE [Planotetraspora kaengkrachanensis]